MFSRGAVNGAAINTYPVNGGGFVEEIDASVSVEFDASAKIVRRVSTSAEIAATFDIFADFRRRAVLGGATGLTFDVTAGMARRVYFRSVTSVRFNVTAFPSFKSLNRASLQRRYQLLPKVRTIAVPTGSSRLVLVDPDSDVVVTRQRRSV